MSNPTPFVTIPRVAATHVLSASAVELDSGDLTLSKPTTTASQGHPPVLTLSVGKAAFPLYETTAVGTVAGDERIYVFRPELGEDIKGYVRLTLPDGIREPGSEYQVLQAAFEKVLIDHGLLSAAEGPNEREVTIPSVIVTHELGETSAELAQGDLTLSTINPSEDKPEKDPAAVLMLKVGKAAFPLHRTTLFGTLAQDDRSYAFKPELSDEAATAGQGYVKIVLPEGVSTNKELGWLQEQFEQILIDYGLLKAGIEAAGDELGRSVSEDATKAAEAIRESKKEWLADTPPTRSPITVSPTAHKVTTTGTRATRTLLGAASSVTSAIASAASTAGAWISSAIGPASPSTAESLSSLANAYDAAAAGIATGTSEVKNAATEAVGDVVQHEFGKDVREVGGNVGESVGNVTGAVGQVAEVGAWAAAAGARGAIEEDRKMQEEQGKFTIQEQEESGEFKDVSI